jgi:hypothetical protein
VDLLRDLVEVQQAQVQVAVHQEWFLVEVQVAVRLE